MVPGSGFTGAGTDPHSCLNKKLGLSGFAYQSAGRMSQNVAAFYFRTLQNAQRFLNAFPALQLADDTSSPLYTSPYAQN